MRTFHVAEACLDVAAAVAVQEMFDCLKLVQLHFLNFHLKFYASRVTF